MVDHFERRYTNGRYDDRHYMERKLKDWKVGSWMEVAPLMIKLAYVAQRMSEL